MFWTTWILVIVVANSNTVGNQQLAGNVSVQQIEFRSKEKCQAALQTAIWQVPKGLTLGVFCAEK